MTRYGLKGYEEFKLNNHSVGGADYFHELNKKYLFSAIAHKKCCSDYIKALCLLNKDIEKNIAEIENIILPENNLSKSYVKELVKFLKDLDDVIKLTSHSGSNYIKEILNKLYDYRNESEIYNDFGIKRALKIYNYRFTDIKKSDKIEYIKKASISSIKEIDDNNEEEIVFLNALCKCYCGDTRKFLKELLEKIESTKSKKIKLVRLGDIIEEVSRKIFGYNYKKFLVKDSFIDSIKYGIYAIMNQFVKDVDANITKAEVGIEKEKDENKRKKITKKKYLSVDNYKNLEKLNKIDRSLGIGNAGFLKIFSKLRCKDNKYLFEGINFFPDSDTVNELDLYQIEEEIGNCYTFALGLNVGSNPGCETPGYISGTEADRSSSPEDYLIELTAAVINDLKFLNRGVRKLKDKDEVLNKGEYKVAFRVTKGEESDEQEGSTEVTSESSENTEAEWTQTTSMAIDIMGSASSRKLEGKLEGKVERKVEKNLFHFAYQTKYGDWVYRDGTNGPIGCYGQVVYSEEKWLSAGIEYDSEIVYLAVKR